MRMVRSSVDVVAGSDSTGLGNSTRLIRAMEMMCEAGMSPIHVVKSATSNAATALKMGDMLGSIRPGTEADILGVAGDITHDISNLRKTRLVLKSGVNVRL